MGFFGPTIRGPLARKSFSFLYFQIVFFYFYFQIIVYLSPKQNNTYSLSFLSSKFFLCWYYHNIIFYFISKSNKKNYKKSKKKLNYLLGLVIIFLKNISIFFFRDAAPNTSKFVIFFLPLSPNKISLGHPKKKRQRPYFLVSS